MKIYTRCRTSGTVPNGRLLDARPMLLLPMMTAPRICIGLQTVILILSGLSSLHDALASDEFSLPSRVGSVRISVASYERIPIATISAHPDRYQMRDLRITGTVIAIQTETITNRMICGSAHERTTLTVEDDSGTIELIDMGACGRNMSALKAPMLKVGEQIDLLVHIRVATNQESREATLEATIRFLDRARY
jgi:hypothetical protein